MINDNPNKPNRNQQSDPIVSMNHSKEIKRRNQQEEMHGAPNVGVASYVSRSELIRRVIQNQNKLHKMMVCIVI